MTQNYSVSLEKIIAAHNLEIIYLPKPARSTDRGS